MASKAGSTDRRMVHKRGHDRQTWHVKASSLLLWGVGDKSRKNWIILLPDLWIQWARVKTVPGNNLSSHDLNPLWAKAASHTLDPVLHHGDEKKDFFFPQMIYFNIIILCFAPFCYLCMECLHLYAAFVSLWCVACMQTHLLPTSPFAVGCHLFLIGIGGTGARPSSHGVTGRNMPWKRLPGHYTSETRTI